MRPISSNRARTRPIASYVWLAAPAAALPRMPCALSFKKPPREATCFTRGAFIHVVLTIDGHTDYILDCAQLGGQLVGGSALEIDHRVCVVLTRLIGEVLDIHTSIGNQHGNFSQHRGNIAMDQRNAEITAARH